MIKESPDDPSGYFWRGVCYMTQSDYQRALVEYTRAKMLYTDDAVNQTYITAIAQVNNALGQFDKTLAVVKASPDSVDAETTGIAYYAKGKYKEALKAFDRAVGDDNLYSCAYFGRSKVYEKLGNKTAAERDLQVATKYGYFVDPTLIRFDYSKVKSKSQNSD